MDQTTFGIGGLAQLEAEALARLANARAILSPLAPTYQEALGDQLAGWPRFLDQLYGKIVASGVVGTGTSTHVAKWTGPNTIGNSLITDNGTQISFDASVIVFGTGIAATISFGNISCATTVSGSLVLSSGANCNGALVTNAADPVSAQDLATKNYVDMAVASLASKDDVQASTIAALAAATYNNGSSGVGATLTGNVAAVLTIDGYTPALGDRLLVKNQASAVQNGIYSLTTVGTIVVQWVLTRTTDFNQPNDGINGALVFVLQGATNTHTLWYCTATGAITFGTTNINWSQFTGATYSADGTTLQLVGTTFSLITPIAVSSLPAFNGLISADVGLTDSFPEYNAAASANRAIAFDRIGGFIDPKIFDFRLTTLTGVAVTTTDRTGQGTLYLTPTSNGVNGASTTTAGTARLCLFDGTRWRLYTNGEMSLSLTLTSGSVYDVFVYDNSGTLTLETLVWTNTTTRATALDLQDGILCKHGALTRRYVGTICADGTNTVADSATKRYVANYYNRAWKRCEAQDATATYTTTSTTFVQVGTTNSVNWLSCTGDYFTETKGQAAAIINSAATNIGYLTVGSGTTTEATNSVPGSSYTYSTAVGYLTPVACHCTEIPAAGLTTRYLLWRVTAGTGTIFGDVAGAGVSKAQIALWTMVQV